MTCIVGIVHRGTVYLGADGRIVNGSEALPLAHPKVWPLDGGRLIIGASGSARAAEILRYTLAVPACASVVEQDPMAYMVRAFVPAVQRTLRAAGWEPRGDDGGGGALIAGFRGHLFGLGSKDHDVVEVAGDWDYNGIGYCDAAMGALYATRHGPLSDDPEARIRIALEAESRHTSFVGPPFTILSGGRDLGPA